MRPDLVNNRREFAVVLDRAIDRTESLRAIDPNWGLSNEIMCQLTIVAEVIKGRRTPTEKEKNSIDLGPLAVRNLDESDPEYSDLLKEIYYQFRRYESLPP